MIGGILSGIGGLIGIGVSAHQSNENRDSQEQMNAQNIAATKEINQKNLEMYQQQLDYQKAVQQETWSREDTAIQRQIEDSLAAGISPLANMNGHSSGNIAALPSLPNQHVPQGIAPQFDASGIQAGLMETANLGYLYSKMRSEEHLKKAEQDIQRDHLSMQLSMHKDKLAQDLSVLLSTQDHDKQMLLQESIVQNNANILLQHKGNVNIIYDKKEYELRIEQWARGYQDVVNSYISNSQSTSTSLSGNALSVGLSGSTSESDSVNNSTNLDAALEGYLAANPYPVYCGSDGLWKTPAQFYDYASTIVSKSAKVDSVTDTVQNTMNTINSRF